MTKTYHPSIRVIKPDEKILISFPANKIISREIIESVANQVKKFQESPDTVLVTSGVEIYILKNGKQLLLADELEKVANVRLLDKINKE